MILTLITKGSERPKYLNIACCSLILQHDKRKPGPDVVKATLMFGCIILWHRETTLLPPVVWVKNGKNGRWLSAGRCVACLSVIALSSFVFPLLCCHSRMSVTVWSATGVANAPQSQQTRHPRRWDPGVCTAIYCIHSWAKQYLRSVYTHKNLSKHKMKVKTDQETQILWIKGDSFTSSTLQGPHVEGNEATWRRGSSALRHLWEMGGIIDQRGQLVVKHKRESVRPLKKTLSVMYSSVEALQFYFCVVTKGTVWTILHKSCETFHTQPFCAVCVIHTTTQ